MVSNPSFQLLTFSTQAFALVLVDFHLRVPIGIASPGDAAQLRPADRGVGLESNKALIKH